LQRLWNRLLILFICILCSTSCQTKKSAPPVTAEWAKFEQSFFHEMWSVYPGWASSLGKREYDSQMRIPNATFFEEQKAFLNKYSALLTQVSPHRLSTSEAVDYKLVKNYLESALWDLNVFKTQEWDPSNYNVGNALATLVEAKYDDENLRQKNMIERLKVVPAYYEAAFLKLRLPTKEYLSLAIQQNQGTAKYIENTVRPLMKDSQDPDAEKYLVAASKAVNDYVARLQGMNRSLTKSKGFKSFRIGPELYQQKFALNLQVNATADETYAYALAEKKKALTEMVRLSEPLWLKYFPKTKRPKDDKVAIRKLVDKIAENHAKPNEFVEKVRAQIPELRDFVVEKNLIGLDPSKVLKVRETPEYQQGFSTASIDAPGPFDPDKETFYNVTPLEKMKKDRIESFLKEYNNYTLQILNIHEAIPGHYVQLVYSMKTPSLVKKIFGNGTMIEGWAVYAERMMLENGYGNNEPELMFMYQKWYLRVVCNTILDYEIHNKNLSRSAALSLLMNEAFQEKTEAEMKWERATYSQVQLASYFAGFSEIYKFRELRKKEKGDQFDLKAFHETFLSFGSAPIREIIDLMQSKKM
jgi:uncharacterized protein (DUF885 family)